VSPVDARTYVEEARREKRAALEAAGVPAFAYRFDRSHKAAAAVALYDDAMGEHGPMVAVAGRIVAFRSQGKTAFAHVEDVSGQVQIYLKKDLLTSGWDLVQLLDLDDHLGVRGHLFRTRTGEVTVRATEVTLLAKSLRPLPRGKTQVGPEGAVSHGGLQDPEVRYRQRYADLAVHPDVRQVFRLRTQVVRSIRSFLDEREFLEVETPVLYGGAAARPFVTHHNALDMPLYLRIADELYLKRLLVGGLERVYEIGHDFRNEGMDRTHNPEFTMLELYQAYADYNDILDLTQSLILHVLDDTVRTREIALDGVTLKFEPPWARVSFVGGILERTGLDLRVASDTEMRAVLRTRGVPLERVEELAGGRLQDEVFKTVLEPELIQPTFVLDYPHALSPLAKIHRHDAALTERFELFVGGRELVNAFSELNDPDDARRGRRRGARLRCRLHPGPGIRHAPGGGHGDGRRPPDHAPGRPAVHSGRDPVPGHEAGGINGDPRRPDGSPGHLPVAQPPGVAHRQAISAEPARLPCGVAQHRDLDRRSGRRGHGADRRPWRHERAPRRSPRTNSDRQPPSARAHLRGGAADG
jgi:lysyl-tRNA synthetase, class II